MNRQVIKLGSQRKVSVSAPQRREERPNLTFKAPTFNFRVSRNLSTRQGGFQYLLAKGLFLIFLALTAGAIRKFRVALLKNSSNGLIFREGTINMLDKLYSPLNPLRKQAEGFLSNGVDNIFYNLLIKILPPVEDLKGVYLIDSKNLSLPPE